MLEPGRRRIDRIHRRTDGSEEGSLILAVLLALMVISLVLTMAVGILAGQDKTRTARDFATGQQAADAAVNDALYWFHQYSPTPPVADRLYDLTFSKVKLATPRRGTVGEIAWSWYPMSHIPVQGAYTIAVEASGRNVDRRFMVTLAPQFGAPVGFTAYSHGIFRGTNIINDYTNAARTEVGTNGKLSFSAGTAVGGTVTLWNNLDYPHPDRCVVTSGPATACGAPVRVYQVAPIGELARPTGFDAACAGTPRAWIASRVKAVAGTATAVLPYVAGGTCYSSMLFDTETTAAAGTTANPIRLYVTGDITVRAGVRVNFPASGTPLPNSRTLQVYSQGQTITLMGGTSNSTAAKMGWTLSAPGADCVGIPPGGLAPGSVPADSVFVYGSMSCDTISSPGGWKLYYDRYDTPLYKLPLWAVLDYVAIDS